MPTTFAELWRRRVHLQNLTIQVDRLIDAKRSNADWQPIEDLKYPSSNRFVFDDLEGVDQQSSSGREATSRSRMVPLLRGELFPPFARVRECAPGCTCACDRCAWKRAHPGECARWPATF